MTAGIIIIIIIIIIITKVQRWSRGIAVLFL